MKNWKEYGKNISLPEVLPWCLHGKKGVREGGSESPQTSQIESKWAPSENKAEHYSLPHFLDIKLSDWLNEEKHTLLCGTINESFFLKPFYF
jgi:hypothetical protein